MLAALVLLLLVVPFLGESEEAGCLAVPPAPSVELVYRLQEGGTGDARTQQETVAIICERLEAFEIAGWTAALGEDEIQVLLSPMEGGAAKRAAELLGARGHLAFYDWERNLIGAERRLGAHPGIQPPPGALRRAERDWRTAGRNPDRFTNRQLLLAGAFPSLYGAVKLASKQRPREPCPACSATGPHLYLFDRTPGHALIAGPVGSRAELPAAAAGSGQVLEVPLGTTIVSEHPLDEQGRVRRDLAPGWYALRDRPALTGGDIVDPVQEYGLYNMPTVTFGFTPRGRIAFQRVTRAIARRGRAQVRGPVSSEKAEALSHHFAVALDGEVASRPIINFIENPDGIDGRVGAQISGGFISGEEAEELATTMRIGALPVEMELVRISRR